MIPPALAWTLLAASLWKPGSGQILQPGAVRTLYPEILSTENIDCDCHSSSFDQVYWFHVDPAHEKIQFLGSLNNADRVTPGDRGPNPRHKFTRRGSASFVLRVINVTEDDAGTYSCVLKNRKHQEIWRPGVLLRPGVAPPTSAPEIKPETPRSPTCACGEEPPAHTGCGSLVLWPLVGLLSGLVLALLGTLRYFSRLPKKCRHNFVKRR